MIPPLEEFQNGTAILTLLKGVPCTGTVLDEQGRPVEGVLVVFGEAGAGSPAVPTRTTDARGYFRFGGIRVQHRGDTPILSFFKEGYAPELIELQTTSVTMEAKVMLRRGRSLRVQFTDKEGMPVPDVMLAPDHWRRHRPFRLRFLSDASGQVHWENAPEDVVFYAVLHESFQRQEVHLTASDELQTIVLPRPAIFTGRVIDAQSRQAISSFRLIPGRTFPEMEGHSAWSDWSPRRARMFCNGEYRITIAEPVAMMSRDGKPGERGFHLLKIEAEGYGPAVSRLIANEEELVEIDFELERAAVMKGRVLDPEGNPVVGLNLIVAGPGNPVMVRNGDVWAERHYFVKTDEAGQYVLPEQEENFPILASHPQMGYAVTSCDELKVKSDIQLCAWGQLELTTTAGKDSPPKYYLRPVGRRPENERIHFGSSAVMAKDGTWIFKGLTAGRMRLGIYEQPSNRESEITIENGKTMKLDLRSGRRAVVGQIAIPPEGIVTEEPLAHLRLQRRSSVEAAPGQDVISETTFHLDSQGRFRIDDVDLGLYRLVAFFFRSFPPTETGQLDLAGFAVKDFELADGEEELDLGVMPITPGEEAKR